MLDCQCPRSAEGCWRQARVIDVLTRALCHVCHQGCGELRFVPLDGLSFQGRLIAAHEPLAMEHTG